GVGHVQHAEVGRAPLVREIQVAAATPFEQGDALAAVAVPAQVMAAQMPHPTAFRRALSPGGLGLWGLGQGGLGLGVPGLGGLGVWGLGLWAPGLGAPGLGVLSLGVLSLGMHSHPSVGRGLGGVPYARRARLIRLIIYRAVVTVISDTP